MYPKQELLFNNMKNVTKVLEIGTYMGHSLLIMLLANPNLQITCVDISNEMTLPAITVLNKHFNNAINFIHCDSLNALKALKIVNQKFDFFHIDGHHDNDYITHEFYFIQRLNSRSDNILRVIFDDQDSLLKLQNDIQIQYDINIKIIPVCPWNNVYFEIRM
jgi:hypothetical protein